MTTHVRSKTLREESDSLAGASSTTGEPIESRDPRGAQEISPVTFFGKDYATGEDTALYDFVPQPEDEVAVVEEEEETTAPKGSSAPGSALAAYYDQFKTPVPEPLSDPETPASVDEENGKDSDEPEATTPAAGSATSSPAPSTGSGKQPA